MFKRTFLVIPPAAALTYVVFNIQPPASFTSATPLQLIYFFLPAFLLFTAAANIFLKYWPRSFAFSLGAIILLGFKALEMFNLASISLTVIATVLIIYSLKKPKQNFLKQGEVRPLSRLKKQ